MIAERFETLLKREIGLDTASIGAPAVERAVRECCAAWQGPGTTDLDAYWTALNASPDELQRLIEAVVVPETWFFRDREAFVALARLATERLVSKPSLPLRLLSLPCATGEEPYSMAMALFDAGIAPARFIIDAFDISERAISHAARARYSRNSFRGHQTDFRERHFSAPASAADDGGWLLRSAVRDTVRFRRANLFDAGLFAAAPYDFVFCRNVLIYFDRSTQDRAVGVLDRLLAPDGMLFVGPSETGLLMRHGMSPAKIPLAFAFRRAAIPLAVPLVVLREKARRDPIPFPGWSRAVATVVAAAPGAQGLQAAPRATATQAQLNARRGTAALAPSRPPSPVAVELLAAKGAAGAAALAHAVSVADQGRLAEAALLGAEHVRAHGPSAGAFYLLGLVADASAQAADASAWYRKALYLEPMHREALTHLGALLELQGDHAGARLLNERAARAHGANGANGSRGE